MLLIVAGYKTWHVSAIDIKRNLSDAGIREAVELSLSSCRRLQVNRRSTLLGKKKIEGFYFAI